MRRGSGNVSTDRDGASLNAGCVALGDDGAGGADGAWVDRGGAIGTHGAPFLVMSRTIDDMKSLLLLAPTC
jgi:hypothetical protein